MRRIDSHVYRHVPAYGATVRDVAAAAGVTRWRARRALRRLRDRRQVFPIARRGVDEPVVVYWHPAS